nr:hypothetical protein [Tanacetum cinerariifolium]
MAKNNNKTVVYVLFVFLFVSALTTTEGSVTSFGFTRTTPVCNSVISVQSGDTCFDIAQKFKLSSGLFDFINPNLNCKKLFVGEWICVDGI